MPAYVLPYTECARLYCQEMMKAQVMKQYGRLFLYVYKFVSLYVYKHYHTNSLELIKKIGDANYLIPISFSKSSYLPHFINLFFQIIC